jgi:hypothetical protein
VPRPPTLSDDGLRRSRIAAQLLHRPKRAGAARLVRHLLGIQAQVLPAAGLALRARGEGLTEDRVDRARLRDRSIVWTWAMRGTLHLLPADVLGWVVPITMESGEPQARRRLPQLGIPDDPERAVRAVHRMLDREGPLTRREIDERLQRAGYRPEGYAAAYLVWLGTPRHIVVLGPDRDGEKTYVLSRDWVGPSEALDRQPALAELAGRYLAAHGPATPADLAFWAGIRAAEARRGWKAIEDRLEEVETTRGPMWRLRAHRPEVPRGIVRLLPSFDEYLLGWKDRSYVADGSTWRRVNPGAGWYHLAAVADGRAIGTWKTEKQKDGIAVRVSRFSTVPAAVRRKLREEGQDVGRYLKRPIDVVVD